MLLKGESYYEEEGRSDRLLKSLLCKESGRSEIVRDLPRGMLTAAAIEGLEGSDEKGNVKVGDRASSSIIKYCVLGPIAFRRRRFDSKPL